MKPYIPLLMLLVASCAPAQRAYQVVRTASDIGPQPELIRGTPVPDGERPDIVRITTGSAGCTASVVGKRVVLTASHCVSTGATSTFKTLGKQYSGKAYRSLNYPAGAPQYGDNEPRPLFAPVANDHDIAVVVLTADVDLGGKPYSSVGGAAAVGKEIQIYGYGCVSPGGGGGNDGVLRTGKARISGFSNFDIVSKDGSALCYGDSGGPAYIDDNGKMRQISVNSKGNISTTNYTTRTDVEESKKFFEDVIAQHKVDICGANVTCDGPILPPPGKFVVENAFVKLEVTNKGPLDVEYVKRMVENLARFLELPPQPSGDGDTVNPIGPVHPIAP